MQWVPGEEGEHTLAYLEVARPGKRVRLATGVMPDGGMVGCTHGFWVRFQVGSTAIYRVALILLEVAP